MQKGIYQKNTIKMTTNKPIEKWQLTKLHTLLQLTNKIPYKQDLMDTFCSDGRYPTSSKDLYFDEANNIINYLAAMHQKNDPADLMRKKIISCCREMGWHKSGKADMLRIEAWVMKFGYMHKKLNDYTVQELPQLVTQAENMKRSYLASLK